MWVNYSVRLFLFLLFPAMSSLLRPQVQAMVRLRWQWFRSPAYQDMLHARSLLVTQVGKKYQTDAGLNALLQSLNIPYPTSAVHIGRRVGVLPALIKKHNEAVKELEEVLTSYLKNPDKIPAQRPTKRLGGWMGMGGQKVDAIDYLTQKIKALEERVEVRLCLFPLPLLPLINLLHLLSGRPSANPRAQGRELRFRILRKRSLRSHRREEASREEAAQRSL
jgi:hypothetical protein